MIQRARATKNKACMSGEHQVCPWDEGMLALALCSYDPLVMGSPTMDALPRGGGEPCRSKGWREGVIPTHTHLPFALCSYDPLVMSSPTMDALPRGGESPAAQKAGAKG